MMQQATHVWDADGHLLHAMTYAEDNRLATYNGHAVIHDADGNMIHGPLQGDMAEFLYDSRNRLIRAGNHVYRYDAEDRRIAQLVEGTEIRYVIDPEAYYSQLLMEADDQGNPIAYYIYGHGLIARVDAEGAYQTYHYDRRGSTVALTDLAGHVTDRYTYGIYGELLNAEGETKQPFLYNSRDGVMTDDNGLYYMRARYYHPELKRFINRDVVPGIIAEAQTLNRYAYVNGNPISYVDPFGLARAGDLTFLEKSAYFLRGAGMAAYESVIGIGEMIYYWEDTLAGLEYVIKNPGEAGIAIVQGIQAAYRKIVEGDAKVRSETIGSIVGEVVNPLGRIKQLAMLSKTSKLPSTGKLEINPQFSLEPAFATGGPSQRRLNFNLQFFKSNNTSSGSGNISEGKGKGTNNPKVKEAIEYGNKMHKEFDYGPGINIVTASALIAEIGDINRFPNQNKLARYAGVSQSLSGRVALGAQGKADKAIVNSTACSMN